jgi:hypothetical protein
MFIFKCYILKILDNATIAGLISVALGAFVGSSIYKKQKNIDRHFAAGERLCDYLFLLEQHCKSINQTIDRLSNTYITIIKKADKDAQDVFTNSSLPAEIGTMATTLMYTIPEDISKVESTLSLYFDDNEKIKIDGKKVFSELKIWHDFVQAHATGKSGQKFDLNKRVSEIKELSLEDLETAIKDLISHLR